MAEVSHVLTGLVSNVAESWKVGDDDLICERVKEERSYTFGRKVHGKLPTTGTNSRSDTAVARVVSFGIGYTLEYRIMYRTCRSDRTYRSHRTPVR